MGRRGVSGRSLGWARRARIVGERESIEILTITEIRVPPIFDLQNEKEGDWVTLASSVSLSDSPNPQFLRRGATLSARARRVSGQRASQSVSMTMRNTHS